MENFEGIVALLSFKVGIDQAFHFGRLMETEGEALETLEHPLLSPPILSLSKRNARYTLDT